MTGTITPSLIVALLVALAIAVAVAVRLDRKLTNYKARHPHTADDLNAARKQSRDKSRSTLLGQIQQHIAPYFPEFIGKYNPNDAHFLGDPLDFIVFDGLCEDEVREVVFVEVKTGKSRPNAHQIRVRKAIEAGCVRYELLKLPGMDAVEDVPALETAGAHNPSE